MARLALVLFEPAAEALAAWASAAGAGVYTAPPGAGRLRAAVEAFAAGHTAVLLVAPGHAPAEALLDLAAAELDAPMTAVIGPAPGGRLALLGLTEIVPALLTADGASAEAVEAALASAFDAGLSVVVLPEVDAAARG